MRGMIRMNRPAGPGWGAFSVLPCLLLAAASPGLANPVGQASTAPGAAFAGACAGNTTFGGVGDPGSIYNNGVGINYGNGVSYFTCNAGNSAVGGSVSNSAQNSGSFAGNPWSNQSSATAAPGQIHLQGSNVATTLSSFAGATANGGWNENFTLQITNPNVVLTTPESGFWVVPIDVDGSLSANGLSSLAQFAVAAYENNNEVLFDSGPAWSFFTANNTLSNGEVGYSWDYEQVVYGAGNSVPSLNVNSTILFALPVTFTSSTDTIEAGFYAQLWLTQSSGAPADPTNQTASFQNTVAWGGPGELVLDGVTYQSDDFTVTGTSGFDYENAYSDATPEPPPVTLLVPALGAILLCFRRREGKPHPQA